MKGRKTPGQPSSGPRKPPSGIWRWGKGWVIAGVGILFLTLVVALSFARSGPEATGREASVPITSGLPDFPLIIYQGEDIVGSKEPRFASLLGGKPVVLNFWASNCPPCRAEMPEFEKVWREYRDRVLFVGLDVGRFFPGFGDQEQSKKELRELGITYVAGTPPTVEVVQQLQVLGLPSTLFITSKGQVYKKWVGILNEAKLRDLVEELLRAS